MNITPIYHKVKTKPLSFVIYMAGKTNFNDLAIKIGEAKSADDLEKILDKLPKPPWHGDLEESRKKIKSALISAIDRVFTIGSGMESPSEEDFGIWMRLSAHTY